jgi:anhydro-N-acetylmuramic acid kinase
MKIIGLMSGTSHDGVDAALVEIIQVRGQGSGVGTRESGSNNKDSRGQVFKGSSILKPLEPLNPRILESYPIEVRLISHVHINYPKSLREEISRAFDGDTERICRLNFTLGEIFAEAALSLLRSSDIKPNDVDAIASHGQTIYHIPPSGRKMGSTLQIGEASIIAERTGILTISDFRTRDMAAGGHGAPLVPLADYLLFRKEGQTRAILNIGGIANATIVKEGISDTIAFDIGPGNSLIDEAAKIYSAGRSSFDKKGSMAKSGKPDSNLLDKLLSHPFFKKRPPKSTGREVFGTAFLRKVLKRNTKLTRQDMLSTLTYLTAISIYNAITPFQPDEVIVTGGGTKNLFLMSLIKGKFGERGIVVNNISVYGIPPEAKEAISFAILGYQTLMGNPGNLPNATGAKHSVVLGKITLK